MNRQFKKVMAVLLSLIMLFTMNVPVSAASKNAVKLVMNKTSITVATGFDYQLALKGAVPEDVTWTSSKQNVATVSDRGLVKAVANGKTVIKAKYGNKTYKCNVKVAKVAMSDSSITLVPGGTAKVKLNGTDVQNVKNSKSSVISIDNDGNITALKKGTSKLTFITPAGNKYKCTVKVVNGLSDTDKTMASGDKAQINLVGDKVKTITSSNKDIVTINEDGTVTAVGKGVAMVTVKSKKKKYYAYYNVETPSLSVKDVSLGVKKTKQITVDGNSQPVVWSVDGSSAAVTSDGLVTASSVGKSVVKAKLESGKVLECNVNVLGIGEELSDFDASNYNAAVGKADKIKFTVNSKIDFGTDSVDEESTGSLENAIKLYADGKEVATMYDNGKNGDSVACDGIYSVEYVPSATATGIHEFKAVQGDLASNSAKIYYVDSSKISSDIKATETVNSALKNLESKYSTEQLTQEQKTALEAEIVSYAEKLIQENTILAYDVYDTHVSIKYVSGLTSIYTFPAGATDADGDQISYYVNTYQQDLSAIPESVSYNALYPDEAASLVSNLGNVSLGVSLDNEQVDLDAVRSISENSIVLWNGHGGFDVIHHSYIFTGQNLNESSYPEWADLTSDIVNERILVSTDGKIIFTRKFVDEYVGEITDTLVYLAACCSGTDNKLAQSFLNKGARAVVGMDNVVSSVYDVKLQRDTIVKMAQINAGTSKYYTLSEALNYSKSVNGAKDSLFGAQAVIFGGSYADNMRLVEIRDDKGTISGSILDAITNEPIYDANIALYKNGTLYRNLTADEDGNYSVEIAAGTYQVRITKPGYINFICDVEVFAHELTYTETFLLIEGNVNDLGSASGFINDAHTGNMVEGVRLELRANWNNISGNPIKEVTTDEDGYYSISDVPVGNYTLYALKTGYVPKIINIVVVKDGRGNQNATISTTVSEDQYRIVLEWGEYPEDMDSHLVGSADDGTEYHVYYSHKQAWSDDMLLCDLDVDDTTSYGPETVTLNTTNSRPYYYYVYKYFGTTGTTGSSMSKVSIYKGDRLIRILHVPTDQGDGRFWNVFYILDDQIYIKNTITNEPEIGTYVTGNRGLN